MSKLNTQQLEVVRDFAHHKKNQAVCAVPGSGKTTLLVSATTTQKFKFSRSKAIVAFTNATKETLIKRSPELKKHIHTTYSLGYKALRNTYPEIAEWEVDKNKYKTLVYECLQSDEIITLALQSQLSLKILNSYQFVNELVRLVDLFRVNLKSLKDEQEIYDICSSFLCLPNAALKIAVKVLEFCVKQGFKMGQQGTIDLTDMVWLPCVLEQKNVPVDWPLFDLILVDECQDLSNAQQFILLNIGIPDLSQYLAVGDPRQSIFGFAGSNYMSFDLLAESLQAKEYTLPICYRCGDSIIELLRAFIPEIEGTGKPSIIESLSWMEGLNKLKETESCMVLARTNYSLLKLALYLLDEKKMFSFNRDKFKGPLMGYLNFLKEIDSNFSAIYGLLDADLREAKVSGNGRKIDIINCIQLLINVTQPSSWWEIFRTIKTIFDRGYHPIVLSTIHSSKGDEHDIIFVWDESKLAPGEDMSEEEAIQATNLQIVAYSRAKQYLGLVA